MQMPTNLDSLLREHTVSKELQEEIDFLKVNFLPEAIQTLRVYMPLSNEEEIIKAANKIIDRLMLWLSDVID